MSRQSLEEMIILIIGWKLFKFTKMYYPLEGHLHCGLENNVLSIILCLLMLLNKGSMNPA